MADDYLERLKKFDWERIILELIKYCRNLSSLHGMKSGQLIGKGLSIDDIVGEAVEAVLSGSRKWDPERGELLPFLKLNVVRSIISNTKNAKENTLLDCLDSYYTDTFDENEHKAIKTDNNVTTKSAEQVALENQEHQRIYEAFDEAVCLIGKDKAKIVFECICEGIQKPSEIEILTGIPSLEVSEIKRQLIKKLGVVYAKFK